ncbi:spore germination protein [Priestia megaterium]|uniref:GerA spore germination family protein n=1 Tax=Priestia megaterium (strain ATCC 14581 / DSM 32 / CCUG 1817 / JCM 2506 / NBRC 15308 / NCIMB 9376 / NCTC 10342 / NRRL B-14308 / VKM B-512 / Ford 19) TaxID=1348623 RepID=A0A0B6ASR8_PRIM2|nr:spore germination protein [Priestia megaterium]AJI23748.1 GerA spore germination family protein [Priestia megaterium NBRC 15308 = ATCC 14581]KFM95990.1 GerA spore germination family protein [Priestia megaterium]KGJ78396.1 spore gernimation protein [Priestia megaterium NBRC 15308 = ATCC 14581]MDR4232591.1 spore germination protein [Priestia megaterium]MED3809411.1 spore germination protein [Priestia megaterium]
MRQKYLLKSSNREKTPDCSAAPLYDDVNKNIERLLNELGNSSDISFRMVESPYQKTLKAAVIHVDGLADENIINENIMTPLIQWLKESNQVVTVKEIEEQIPQILTVSQLTIKENWHEFVSAVLTGDTVILLNGSSKIFIGNTKKLQSRAVTEPTSQTVVRGPKDSFTENLRTNTSLIRARIQDSNLRLDSMKIGSVTQTDIGIMYIQGNADERIVEEIKERLKEIKVDGVLESNYIEEFIRDDRTTIFPLLLNTERPDAVVGNLLEGRIAIIVQGTPFVLIAPAIFSQFFQSPEDYYQNYYISSFLRILRFGSFFLSMYASAIYLALITHHQGLIPNTLMVSLMAQRERVPFPAIVEMIVMELAFEMLREAGIRMPRAIGPAVSIVGALILGQAAVEAGFVSAAVVIIVAISAISNFTLPSTSIVNAARGFRFILILISAFIGLYGILLMTLCIWLHISSLRSFGIPYFSPFAPFDFKEQKDTLVRFSLPSLLKKHQNK